MKYKGRIVIVTVMLLLTVATRIYYIVSLNLPPYQFPLFGIIAISVAWWLGGKYDKVKFLSEKDLLTKIYNRRYIVQIFPKILAMVKRRNEPLSMLLIDVDNFKAINDTYGHETGDKVLQAIAYALSKSTSKSEIAARWAGDEFLIIAPFFNEQGTELMTRRIHNELRKSAEEILVDFSVSIGISVYPRHGETLEALFKAADQSMYLLKSRQKENYPR